MQAVNLPLIDASIVEQDGNSYALTRLNGEKRLLVQGDKSGFEGEAIQEDTLLCLLSPTNARELRQRLNWLKPVCLGLATSAGFGDRLGKATIGHIRATEGTGVAPIFAQQSVRENARTGRSPQEVVDDAMWGVFEAGWREAWGADADHLKAVSDIPPFVAAGYSFFTIDPNEHVDDAAETDSFADLQAKAEAFAWEKLGTSLADTKARYLAAEIVSFDEHRLLKAIVKYGAAIAHTATMASALAEAFPSGAFELEMSVDETGTTTSLEEHFYIVSELKRLKVPFVSLAPRFVGSFEKGVDYIGDLQELEENIAGHAALMQHFGNSYKLSLHTGSDKFGVYPIAVRYTKGLVHLKTAGTSYLEALRLLATLDKPFFREILGFALSRYETDRKSYHVSAVLEKVPALPDSDLADLLDDFHARQVLHVTFGSVLDTFGARLHAFLQREEVGYHDYIKRHFDKHLQAFRKG
jgi:tagaturonate epimerase